MGKLSNCIVFYFNFKLTVEWRFYPEWTDMSLETRVFPRRREIYIGHFSSCFLAVWVKWSTLKETSKARQYSRGAVRAVDH